MRASLYAQLCLFILQILVEDPVIATQMTVTDSKLDVWLCKQRRPHMPDAKGERAVACVIMDIMIDGMNHNLRRKLDVGFYM